MGKHSRATVCWWAPSGRSTTRTAALAAGMLGTAVTLLAGPAAAAQAPALVDGTPCTATAKACVDLDGDHAWLIQDGHTIRGPVPITQGADGENTPRGSFTVQWKDLHHRSAEYNNAPMEYSVFFAPGGIAFHEGSLQNQSAGCIHLSHDDAVAWFDHLQVGDEVQVH